MDTNQTLISSAISIGAYIVYKMAQRYYLRSGCHDRTLEISIVDKESPKKDASASPAIELSIIPPTAPANPPTNTTTNHS
jgi:hypothetical protein